MKTELVPGRRRRKQLAALAIGLMVGGLVLVGAELAFRKRATGSFGMVSRQWVRDPDLIYKLNPDNPAFPRSFRGEAPRPDRGGDSTRVLCMGGSATYGHDLRAFEAWPAVVGAFLAARDVRAEVINAGVPGYGSRQLLLRYGRDLAALEPEIVVLYTGWNRTGALVDPDEWVPLGITRAGDGWLTRHSLVYQKVLMRMVAYQERPWRADPHREIFADDLRMLVREIVEAGQLPVLVLFPALYHDDMTPEESEIYSRKLWRGAVLDPAMVDELLSKHAVIADLAQEFGAPLVDVQGALRELRGQERDELFLDEMHLSVAGSRRVGSIIGDALLGLIRRGSDDPART